MLAVRVPPSASSTSQSTAIGPLAQRVQIDDRPQAAADQPLNFGRAAVDFAARSRRFRGLVLPGSMLYSAVTQPRPLPAIQVGTFGSTLAVQSTVVRAGLNQHAAGGRAREAAL